LDSFRLTGRTGQSTIQAEARGHRRKVIGD
jgi:hypothetical protein